MKFRTARSRNNVVESICGDYIQHCRFEMESTNKKLRDLYESTFDELMSFKRENSSRKISGPHLLKVPERYFEQRKRIMFIGQQTCGWAENKLLCSEILDEYEAFDLARNYKSTPFWDIIRKIERSMQQGECTSAWSNVNKFDENTKRPLPDLELLLSKFDFLLYKEIEILSPELIVFFTGQKFDQRIKNLFEGALFTRLDTMSEKVIARISHPDLPVNTYRTFHPKYLRLRKIENNVISVIQKTMTA